MTRRALFRLLGLLPFAPLLRLAPARVASFPAYAVVPVTVRKGITVYGGSVVIDELAVPGLKEALERQRQREAAFAAALYRDGAP